MTGLPQVCGPDLVHALQKAGSTCAASIEAASIMRRDKPFAQTVIPNHRRIDRGTLRAILRQVGISADELIRPL